MEEEDSRLSDLSKARALARRYRCDFINLRNVRLQPEVLKNVPAELMFRYNFVPLEKTADGRLAIAIADPSQLMMIDEISLLLNQRIVTRVSTLTQISEILKQMPDQAKGIDEHSRQLLDPASDDPLGPKLPDPAVRAPLKPRPYLRSGGAMAVPDEEQ